MSRNTIKINGEKLRTLLESSTGKNLYQIAEENGFSRNIIIESIRNGRASPIIQNIAKLYGIAPEAYQIKEEPAPVKEPEQMTIKEFNVFTPEDFKKAIKEGIYEAIEENIPYIVAEFGKTTKGTIKAAMRETLISFGWNLKEVKK